MTGFMTIETTVPTKHQRLLSWVEEVAELARPAAIHWCDGSAEEYDALCAELVEAGTVEKLSEGKRPKSHPARRDPGGRARRGGPTLLFPGAAGGAGPAHQPRGPG